MSFSQIREKKFFSREFIFTDQGVFFYFAGIYFRGLKGHPRNRRKFLPLKYLSHQKQNTKINKTFSNWTIILHGVPQGSILGPLLVNVFLCDLFLFIPNIDSVGYADDNTPFAMGSSELEVINEIKSVAENLTLWFRNNCIKVNPDSFHLLLSDKKNSSGGYM